MKRKFLLVTITLALLVFMNSCDDKPIIDPIDPTEDATDHSGTLTEDATWGAGETHIIDGTVYLKGNTITIEPGAIIKFKANSQIIVGEDPNASTTLLAVGTAEKPIIFTSANATPVAGDWYGITFDEGTSPNTKLQFCTFEYGGGYSDDSQIIFVRNNTKLSMDNCIVRHSSSNGIDLYDDESRFSSFSNNVISDVAKNAMLLKPNNADCIGTGNIFTTDGTYGLAITSGTLTKKGEVTWAAQTVPYIITSDFRVESTTGTTLIIEPGTTISFMKNKNMRFAYGSNTFATIIANGTADKPIVFTSANATPSAGDWYDLKMYDGSTGNSFKYCTFEYGGGYDDGSALLIADDGVDVEIENCTFKHSSSYGLLLYQSSELKSFKNNTMSNIDNHFVYCSANQVGGFGTGNDFQTTISNKGILVASSTMDKTATWKKQNAPYVLKGDTRVGDANGVTLTIDAGTTILFQHNANLRLAYSSNTYGKIIAQGTSDEKITFSSAAPVGSQGSGDWYDVILYDGTSPGTIFDNCIFEYGGGYDSSSALLKLYSCSNNNVTISNSLFQHSSSNGINYDSNNGTPSISGNSFNDIAGENVHVY